MIQFNYKPLYDNVNNDKILLEWKTYDIYNISLST